MTHPTSIRQAKRFAIAAATLGLAGMASATMEPAAGAASPFFGTWQLDLGRMPATYGPPPKQVLYTIADAGGGRWRTTVDVTAPDDTVRHMAVTYRPDGTMAPGEGDTGEADSAAIMVPSPRVMVMNLAKNGRPGSVRVYTVSDDGRGMTESAAGATGTGEPFVRNFRFRRIR